MSNTVASQAVMPTLLLPKEGSPLISCYGENAEILITVDMTYSTDGKNGKKSIVFYSGLVNLKLMDTCVILEDYNGNIEDPSYDNFSITATDDAAKTLTDNYKRCDSQENETSLTRYDVDNFEIYVPKELTTSSKEIYRDEYTWLLTKQPKTSTSDENFLDACEWSMAEYENDLEVDVESLNVVSNNANGSTILFVDNELNSMKNYVSDDPFLEFAGSNRNNICHLENYFSTAPTSADTSTEESKIISSIHCAANDTSQQTLGDNMQPLYNEDNSSETHRATDKSSTMQNMIPCSLCDRKFKTTDKLKKHIEDHADPDKQCSLCSRALSSKGSLKTHKKLHDNKNHICPHCKTSFWKLKLLENHIQSKHKVITIISDQVNEEPIIDNISNNDDAFFYLLDKLFTSESELESFQTCIEDDINNTDEVLNVTDISECMDEKSILNPSQNIVVDDSVVIKDADSIITKVISSKIFHKKDCKRRDRSKVCNVCSKLFNRSGDLIRHLIEHIIQSTITKNAAQRNGVNKIQCAVCCIETLSSIAEYKEHLRYHAKVTIYKCTICQKSFSDSSNFSKHKKVHGNARYQCDLCRRKFQSKAMIIRHMEYHNVHSPLNCQYCDAIFYFKSELKKHLKSIHSGKQELRFRCCLCKEPFKSVKDKWDHEWSAHNMRKCVVDCFVCQSQFRKYSELKRHCVKEHAVKLPTTRKLHSSTGTR